MISPDTPPGTEVVCINVEPGRFGPAEPLILGEIYTIKQICQSGDGEFGAWLQEVPIRMIWVGAISYRMGWALYRFRYLDTGGLESLLHTRVSEDA